jgi:thiamine pyrophosphate-dependent acetolactate synthase large subunit-like protein
MTSVSQPASPAPAPPAAGDGLSLAQALMELVATLGERCAQPPRCPGVVDRTSCAYFLISAASVAWVEAAVAHPRIRAVDVAIEHMATFAAIEASRATGRLQTVLCGSGPGTLGHLVAVPAARGQGAALLMLVPRTPPPLASAIDIQESSWEAPLHRVGASLFDDSIELERVAELPRIARRLHHLFARPQGAVVRLSVPTDLLRMPCPPLPDLGAIEIALPAPDARTVARVAGLLSGPGGPPAFLFGSGAVAFRHRLGPLVERWDAVHFTTPAATAILPGSLGVVGNGAHGDVPAQLRARDVRCVVVLGSRLGTASGGGDAELLPPGCHVVHVDIDPRVIAGNAVATWDRPVTFVPADIGHFIDALIPDQQGATCATP